ncbi:MAG: hypothetical protein IT353_16280 [Gemmatimonadaceae bacterium]|nr:hypothetical protein [Gemmatimonadaceae bacterium]
MLLGVLVGFAPTFYLRSPFNGPELPWWLLLHGVAQTAWFAVLAAQATFNALRLRSWHKWLGWTGMLIALLVLVTTPVVMIRAVPRGLAAGLTEIELGFVLMVNVLRLPFFAVMVASALHYRRTREVHARALLLASLSNFAPATSRMAHFVGVSPIVGVLVFMAAFCIPLVLHDRRTLGRVHALTRWGIVALLLMIAIPIALLFAGVGQAAVRALA